MALFAGTALYNGVFVSWRFRSIITAAQAFLCAVGLFDLLFVTRVNRAIGVPDLAVYLVGDEVMFQIADRLQSLPFYIFAAKLCPPDVEASMFALLMGLANCGTSAGYYLGSAALDWFGTHEPSYAHLESYILLRSTMRLLPIALVPILVPRGTPADTAREIGAGRNVTGDDDAPTARLRPGDGVGMVETHTRESQGAAPAPAGAAPGVARRKPTN